jgi:hypothetical protein
MLLKLLLLFSLDLLSSEPEPAALFAMIKRSMVERARARDSGLAPRVGAELLDELDAKEHPDVVVVGIEGNGEGSLRSELLPLGLAKILENDALCPT